VWISGVGASGNVVQGNKIGTDVSGLTNALGNFLDGVRIDSGAANNTIGGTEAGAGNVIAFNQGNGVVVGASATDASAGDSILGNAIFANARLGIDLGNNGVTLNDSQGHSGPNRFQDFPVLSSAALVNGVTTIKGTLTTSPNVTLPGPIGVEHGRAQVALVVWLGHYDEKTRGVQALSRVTTILGWRSELEPDAQLRVLPECGGRTRDAKDFVRGAPELVAEVAEAIRYMDLGPKKADYERAGVQEYVVRAIDPDEIFWFGQEQGELVPRPIGDDGLYRSTVFPGLWLDPVALVNSDTRRLRAVVDLGCATPKRAAFVARLAERRNPS
jgi:hypothetical protein